MLVVAFLTLFFALSVLFSAVPSGDSEIARVLLPLAVFFFAIYSGFFISLQGRRYQQIVQLLAQFDGGASALYRLIQQLGKDAEEAMVKNIRKYYEAIVKHNAWDYNLTHKSSLLSTTHDIVGNAGKRGSFGDVQRAAVVSIFISLNQLQVVRKQLIVLHDQRTPALQWFFLAFIAVNVFFALMLFHTAGMLFPALLKAALATSVFFVMYLLYGLDRLQFFSGRLGETSARDVLDILAGKK